MVMNMDVLNLPLDQLAELSMDNLNTSKTLERASRSGLYKEKWKAAKSSLKKFKRTMTFLNSLYLTSKELRKAMYEQPIGRHFMFEVAHCLVQPVQRVCQNGSLIAKRH